jgi:hypothetical protein
MLQYDHNETDHERNDPEIRGTVFPGVFPCQTIQNPKLPSLTTSEKMTWSTYAIATEKGLGTCEGI